MRKLIVPIMFSNLTKENREEYLCHMKDTKTDSVFIVMHELFYMNEHDSITEQLEDHVRFFEDNGLEVGIWLRGFGFGIPLTEEQQRFTAGMMKIKSVLGNECGDAFCPEDPKFMEAYLKMIRTAAKIKPSLLMLDDDLCLSVRPGIGCFCDRHMKLLEEKLGHALNKETLATDIFVGDGNEYRRAWLDVMGDSLRKFGQTVSRAVAEISPDTRVGFCAGFTSWDIEGIDAAELTKVLAGKNKPFLRFTGAPYWVAPHWNRFRGQRLHGVIEFARAQEAWCEGSGIECFSEADSYPRPRYHIPGNLLECFDAAMMASGDSGNLKYYLDYYSPVSYETGYARLHKKNFGLYDYLDKNFKNKKSFGIRVFEKMRKIADMTLPEDFGEYKVMNTALPFAAAMLTSLAIPVHYGSGGNDCGIAFGDNVKGIDKMPKKMILDFNAAEILCKQGIDTGLVSYEKAQTPSVEMFGDTRISLTFPEGKHYKCSLKDGAVVKSTFVSEKGTYPSAYTYFNGETEFLVFTFDAYTVNQSSGIYCSYARQAQILDFYSDFPVVRNSPFLYQLCKRSESETVSFFANIFEDEMWDFDIELDGDYSNAECFGADVELRGKVLHVSSTVPAYGMFAIKLIK